MGVKPMTRAYFQETKRELLDLNYVYSEVEDRVIDAIERLEATVENGGWADVTDDDINDWAWHVFVADDGSARRSTWDPTGNFVQAVRCATETPHNVSVFFIEDAHNTTQCHVGMGIQELHVGPWDPPEIANKIMRYLYEKEKE